MSSPLISIIIPTYNYGHLIGETLTCLENQSYHNWEAIIVDDGSTDQTPEIVHKFAQTDARFTYIRQNNSGVSVARNKGLGLASGEFIQFLDADDLISREKISIQVMYLQENTEVDLVNVNTRYFHTNNPTALFTDLNLTNADERQKVRGKGFDTILELVEHNPIVVQGPVFRKLILSHVHNFAENMSYLEDWDFWLRIALHNYRFDHIDHHEAISMVRTHPTSTSQIGTKTPEGEGFFRSRINALITASPRLTEAQKKALVNLNSRELKNTYKNLMAKTPLFNTGKFKDYYDQLNNPLLFINCLFKAMNLKRKARR